MCLSFSKVNNALAGKDFLLESGRRLRAVIQRRSLGPVESTTIYNNLQQSTCGIQEPLES